FNTHGLGGDHLDDGRVTRLDELGSSFQGLTGTSVDLFDQFSELTGNVSSVTIQNGSVTSTNLTGVVQDN
ncbi:hypothetical protein XD15_00025, partial [Staphylococcus aureus]|nr:hypothetical protein [Staphylococcus aureus]